MLCLQDCLDFSDIPQATITAIAEHEQVPEIVAAEIGCTLVTSRQGICRIRQFIRDNMSHARDCGQKAKVRDLDRTYHEFEEAYPLRPRAARREALGRSFS